MVLSLVLQKNRGLSIFDMERDISDAFEDIFDIRNNFRIGGRLVAAASVAAQPSLKQAPNK